MKRWTMILGLLLAMCAAAAAEGQETPAPTPEQPAPAPTPGQPPPAPTPQQPPPAPPQEQPKKELVLPIAITYSAFRPVYGDTKNTFGHHWNSIGATIFRPVVPMRYAFTFDVDYRSKSLGDNDSTLVGLTGGVDHALGRDRNIQPYASARIGPYYHNLKFNGEHDTGLGFNANAGLGVILKRRVFIEFRYNYYTPAAGFNFSGWSWEAGIRVYDFKVRR
jgi:hypothetical protein